MNSRAPAAILAPVAFLLASCGAGDATVADGSDPRAAQAARPANAAAGPAPGDASRDAPPPPAKPPDDGRPAVSPTHVTVLLPSGKSLIAEVADDPDERTLGLMFREHLPADRGMLLVFPHEGPHGIWMKNCLIPLDLLWLDRAGKVLALEENVPPCREDPCPSWAPRVAARFVLELAAGTVRVEGIAPGSTLRLVPPILPR